VRPSSRTSTGASHVADRKEEDLGIVVSKRGDQVGDRLRVVPENLAEIC
jgi:hypothetical protein